MGKARVHVSPSINVTKALAQALILPAPNGDVSVNVSKGTCNQL
jgi:hypothetical protein